MKATTLRLPGWEHDGTETPPVLIELTAKRWKGLILVSFGAGLLGFLFLGWQVWVDVYKPLTVSGFNTEISALAGFGDVLISFGGTLGLLLLILSFGIGIYARFMAWWRHG